jgi:hypothetical protein
LHKRARAAAAQGEAGRFRQESVKFWLRRLLEQCPPQRVQRITIPVPSRKVLKERAWPMGFRRRSAMTSLYPGQRWFRGGAVARETFKQDAQIQWFLLARHSW